MKALLTWFVVWAVFWAVVLGLGRIGYLLSH